MFHPAKRTRAIPRALTLIAITTVAAACSPDPDDARQSAAPQVTEPAPATMAESRAAAMPARSFEQIAEVSIEPRSGAAVSGGIAFDELDGLLRIHGVLTGLKPGVHGFHIHETGDCSADDAASAGGHYAPLSKNHGAPSQPVAQRHAGDLGNIVAGEDGTAAIDILVSASGPDDLGQRILGKAVVVHGAADDLTSQPSGAAGDRVGCGVIQTIS